MCPYPVQWATVFALRWVAIFTRVPWFYGKHLIVAVIFYSVTCCLCVFSCCSPLPCLYFLRFFRVANLRRLFSILRGFATTNLRNIATVLFLDGGFYFRQSCNFTQVLFFLKDGLFSFSNVQCLHFVLHTTVITICIYSIAVLSRCHPLFSSCFLINSQTETLPWVLPITQVDFCINLFFS